MPYLVALESSAVGWNDFSSVLSGLTGQISATTILAVIAGVIGATVGIGFAWFGARYVVRKLQAALKGGKVSA